MTIVDRSAWFLQEHPLPPDVACLIRAFPGQPFRRVTWQEILQKRRAHQALVLSRIRQVPIRRAIRISVWYLDSFIYGGWHCYIDAVNSDPCWVRNEDPELMAAFPLAKNWENWKPAFAKKFQRGTHHRKPRGMVYAWGEYWGRSFDRFTSLPSL